MENENKKIAELELQISRLMVQSHSSAKQQEELTQLYEFRDKYVDLEIANSLLTSKNKSLQDELLSVKANLQILSSQPEQKVEMPPVADLKSKFEASQSTAAPQSNPSPKFVNSQSSKSTPAIKLPPTIKPSPIEVESPPKSPEPTPTKLQEEPPSSRIASSTPEIAQNVVSNEPVLNRRLLVAKNDIYPPRRYRGIMSFMKERYNVYFRNNIQLKCSGCQKNHDVSKIYGWDVFAFISENEPNSWVSIEFISMEIDIYGYKIKSSNANRFCAWKLEGQNKNGPLTLIDKRENDALKVSNCESEFVCQNPGTFSKFILTMIGSQFGVNNSYKMYVCGMDIYGSAYFLE